MIVFRNLRKTSLDFSLSKVKTYMKSTLNALAVSVLLVLVGCSSPENDSSSATAPASAIDQRVEDILANLSVEDKIGEMTQLSLDMILVGPPYGAVEPHVLDTALLRKVIVDLRVGSMLNCAGHTLDREFWNATMKTIQDLAMEVKGVPVLYGIDAIHGPTYTVGGTLGPQQIAQAATWNPELSRRLAEQCAYEVRASGIPWNFAPVLDIGRDARWPRLWETFGEDTYLASRMGEAMIQGFQGEGDIDQYHVAACMKHFLGYSTSLTGNDRTQAWISERQLREYFVPTFKAAIDAGAKTVMINSGDMNGIPVHADSWVLQDLLRDELGFEGLVVTDWEDIKYLYERHMVADSYKSAIKMAIDAGIDMSMVPIDFDFPVLLKELVDEGEITEARLDESVRRILKLKVELGLFENPYPNGIDFPEFGSEDAVSTAKQAALEAITLLKNENGTLPIAKGTTTWVCGPNAASLNALNGGWTHTWQGVEEKFNTPEKKTILEAMVVANPRHTPHSLVLGETGETHLIPTDVRATSGDVIVVCLGETPYTEGVGDIEDLTLAQDQIDFVKDLSESTDAKIVAVLVEGRPRTIAEIEPLCDAVVMAYLPGDEGAEAIAEVLFGDYNPGGKLPFTYPRNPSLHVCYDYKRTDMVHTDFSMNAVNPQWEFGHGLSYTSFEYSDLTLSSASLGADGELEILVTVTNSGDRSGAEVVQLYISDSVATIVPSVKRLRGFEKINLDAGASQTVSFTISPRDLAFVGRANKWITEPGDFRVRISDLNQGFVLDSEQVLEFSD